MPGTAFDQFRLFETACGGAVMGGQPLARPGRAVYADARLRARLSEIPRPIAPERPAPSQRYETAAGERGERGPTRGGRGLLAAHIREARGVERTARRVLAAISSRSRMAIERDLWPDWESYVAAFDPAADPRDPALEALFLDRCLAEALRRHGGEPAIEEALSLT